MPGYQMFFVLTCGLLDFNESHGDNRVINVTFNSGHLSVVMVYWIYLSMAFSHNFLYLISWKTDTWQVNC